MSDPYWFFKKWGLDEIPADSLLKRIEDLEKKVIRLEEENVETTNTLYEIMHSVDAVDARIDILAEKCGCITDV
jgi:uncharacterized Rmd1/YagE family protein